MLDGPEVIRVGVADWLVVDAAVRPRYLIHYGPAVHKVTGETLMRYRVDHWVLEREKRWQVGFFETLREAEEATVGELTRDEGARPQAGPPNGRLPDGSFWQPPATGVP